MVGSEPHAVTLEGEANSLAFNANATQLAGGGDGVLRLWDLTKPGRVGRVIALPVGSPASLAYNVQGTKIAASVKQAVAGRSDSNEADWYGMVVFDLEHDRWIQLERGSGETPLVNAVSWDPAGVRIATAENDHTLRIWSVDDVCRLLCTLRDARGYLDSVAWSRDGAWIAGGSPNEGAYLYCGAQDDREAEFILRELQRENPISRDLKKRWNGFSEIHRFASPRNSLSETATIRGPSRPGHGNNCSSRPTAM